MTPTSNRIHSQQDALVLNIYKMSCILHTNSRIFWSINLASIVRVSISHFSLTFEGSLCSLFAWQNDGLHEIMKLLIVAWREGT
jgi:hypothetical protein